uniref:Putative ovule protein n=1 Tax=Solanum chacoense TaxID=4108 RepID=A0A0V0HBU1_SOLCH
MDVEGFKKKAEEWWNSFVIQERPDYILSCKHKLMKTKLKEWNASNGGNLKKNKINLLNQTVDHVQEQGPLSAYLDWLKKVTFKSKIKIKL